MYLTDMLREAVFLRRSIHTWVVFSIFVSGLPTKRVAWVSRVTELFNAVSNWVIRASSCSILSDI
jgi:hypothetical protein